MIAMIIQGAVIGVLAILVALIPDAFPVVAIAFTLWMFSTCNVVMAHGHRVLVRTFGTNEVSLRDGCFWLCFPQYRVQDKKQLGPWCQRGQLPQVGQVLDIDVPAILVPVDNGLYCLQVNTKVIGKVESYTVQDLIQNPVPVEQRCHDTIAQALRVAVYDKPLEDAIAEIQRTFLKDADSVSALIAVPAFRATQLLLDANACIGPADDATKNALQICVQRKQQSAKCAVLEASMETEEQNVKVRRIELQAKREQMELERDIYGKDGCAMVEASKNCKVLYMNWSTVPNNTVLTLPAI